MTLPSQPIRITIGLADGGRRAYRRPAGPRRPLARRLFLRAAGFRPPRAAAPPRGRLEVLAARGRPDVPPRGRESVLGAQVAIMPTIASIYRPTKDPNGNISALD